MARTAMDEVKAGAFLRTASAHRNFIGTPEFPAEAGRYHLYVSYACPWASRCLAVRSMKGLVGAISLSVVAAVMEKTKPDDPSDEHVGWVFKTAEEEDGCVEDIVGGFKTVRDLYEVHGSTGKYTVPILYDKVQKKIVNNESSEIIRMFNIEMNEFAENKEANFYPDDMKTAIDEVNEWVYPNINNGVYRAGFATKQEPYDEAIDDLFTHLDKANLVLSKQRYIAHPTRLTEADIRLFVTLVRFDEVYVGHFKCNKKRIADYEALENYVREIYQMPGVAETVKMKHIKEHYHRSHKTINLYGIVPVGPRVDYTLPHNRDRVYDLQK